MTRRLRNVSIMRKGEDVGIEKSEKEKIGLLYILYHNVLSRIIDTTVVPA